MAIIHLAKRQRYVLIDARAVEDSRLSWEARGVLTYLMSKPSNWEISSTHLIAKSPAGRDKVYKILKELEVFGYLKKVPAKHNKAGKFAGTEWIAYEVPHTENPDTVEPHTDLPDTANPDTVEDQQNQQPNPHTEIPDAVQWVKSPHPDLPYPAKPQQVNIENTANTEKKDISPSIEIEGPQSRRSDATEDSTQQPASASSESPRNGKRYTWDTAPNHYKLERIFEYLNTVDGREGRSEFQVKSPNGKLTTGADFCLQRIKDGWTWQDFKAVIVHQHRDTSRNDETRRYYNPETIFRKRNFERILDHAKTEAVA